jgi:hypothetical protein
LEQGRRFVSSGQILRYDPAAGQGLSSEDAESRMQKAGATPFIIYHFMKVDIPDLKSIISPSVHRNVQRRRRRSSFPPGSCPSALPHFFRHSKSKILNFPHPLRVKVCPQMTQMHAVEFRVPLFPICVHLRYLRAIPNSVAAGRAGSSVVHFFPVAVVKSLPSGTVPIRANQGAIRANQG